MRAQFGTTTVTTAGTRVQVSTAADPVKHIQFQARVGNTGRMFIFADTRIMDKYGFPGLERP